MDLQELEKNIPEIYTKNGINILFLDLSSTCTGYAIASLNFKTKKAKFEKAGCLWFDDKWDHQEKYSYFAEAIRNYFYIVQQVDFIIVESYAINPSKMMGCLVAPELHGVLKTAAQDNNIKVVTFTPQEWRKAIEIKPTTTIDSKTNKKKREYKEPTKQKVLELVDVPEKVLSNITGNERGTPSDLYDAIGLGWGWLLKFGFKIDRTTTQFNEHIGVMNK